MEIFLFVPSLSNQYCPTQKKLIPIKPHFPSRTNLCLRSAGLPPRPHHLFFLGQPPWAMPLLIRLPGASPCWLSPPPRASSMGPGQLRVGQEQPHESSVLKLSHLQLCPAISSELVWLLALWSTAGISSCTASDIDGFGVWSSGCGWSRRAWIFRGPCVDGADLWGEFQNWLNLFQWRDGSRLHCSQCCLEVGFPKLHQLCLQFAPLKSSLFMKTNRQGVTAQTFSTWQELLLRINEKRKITSFCFAREFKCFKI